MDGECFQARAIAWPDRQVEEISLSPTCVLASDVYKATQITPPLDRSILENERVSISSV